MDFIKTVIFNHHTQNIKHCPTSIDWILRQIVSLICVIQDDQRRQRYYFQTALVTGFTSLQRHIRLVPFVGVTSGKWSKHVALTAERTDVGALEQRIILQCPIIKYLTLKGRSSLYTISRWSFCDLQLHFDAESVKFDKLMNNRGFRKKFWVISTKTYIFAVFLMWWQRLWHKKS